MGRNKNNKIRTKNGISADQSYDRGKNINVNWQRFKKH